MKQHEGWAPSVAVMVSVLLLAVVLIFMLAFNIGQGCAPVVEPIVVDIDAGPAELEIANRLDGAVRAAEERLARIEAEHAAEIAAFNDAQLKKYEQLRDDPDAADAFIRDFNRRLREGRP